MLDNEEWRRMLGKGTDQRGMTLPELMIGMAVLAILASVGTPAFQAWTENAQLRNAAESLSNALQLARAEAVRRNTSVTFTLVSAKTVPGTALPDASWTVGCATPAGDLNGDGVLDCPGTIQSQSNVPTHVAVTADVKTVTFTSLGRATNDMALALQNPTGGDCAALGGPMRCLNVTVGKGGQIRMCNPALSHATNPQGC